MRVSLHWWTIFSPDGRVAEPRSIASRFGVRIGSIEMSRTFHAAYFETVFFGEALPKNMGTSFAIITAFAPTGRKWSQEKNRHADACLKDRLARWRPHRITGSSEDRKHQENGWAVACARSTAIRIGHEFQQDAIFWVRGDKLSIIDTSRDRRPARAGSFKAKFWEITAEIAPEDVCGLVTSPDGDGSRNGHFKG